ncbi:NAD(P)-dependent oxidoreductase [Pseudomonas stutzeri]|uniref:NAD(P)-dependent oxidoreductase n=1 Tax=Stutzerimonas stutzeri TaxID=316 RepID=UPI00210D2777|nr:NAD(P)-dependent oxidoreductase [Stutzerimonas stutzeri]MCQ4314311.1 NAD(P)-dependent oxidoreductase [Stutzerimonas stutzeri]
MKIAVVGLGNMGGRVAKRLMEQGHEVGIYDTDAAAVARFAELGATGYQSLKTLGAEHPFVITVLPNGDIVKKVVFGEQGLAAGMREGSTLIDMTSSVPAITTEVGQALSKQGIHMLDAPVSGGVKKAETGQLTIMVGGNAAVLADADAILRDVGEHVIHVGDLGAGHTVKALNNLITATTLAITSEAMALGVKMGVDAQKMLDVINVGSGKSVSSEMKFPQQVMSRKFDVGFTVGLMCKDVGIALDMAHQAGVPTFVSSAAYELWKFGVAKGCGAMDHTAIALVVEEMAGVEIKG